MKSQGRGCVSGVLGNDAGDEELAPVRGWANFKFFFNLLFSPFIQSLSVIPGQLLCCCLKIIGSKIKFRTLLVTKQLDLCLVNAKFEFLNGKRSEKVFLSTQIILQF